jgi:hypothetical protein
VNLKYAKCGAPRERTAFLCYEVDEYISSYFFCPDCGVYTVEVYHDHFLGPSTASVQGPVSREAGDAAVEKIRRCPKPSSKRCDCPTHRECE